MRTTRPRRLVDPDLAPRPIFVLEERYRASEGPWHAHRRGQLVHAATGVLTVTTPAGRWLVPPQRAVWVPPGMKHSVASNRPFRLLTLYVDRELAPWPDACRVVAVDRLVAELLGAAASFGANYPPGGAEARLLRVALDRIPALATAPLLHLPEPTSAALRGIARRLRANPSDPRTLPAWARLVALTPRTLARHFVAETGLSFGRWRQQLRLLLALERLALGEKVTSAALEVGYEDVSSFIAAFKAALGETPARYFRSVEP